MLQLKNIDLKYGNRQIIKDLAFDFCTGFTIITGENGSGKTSILNIITGQSTEYSGSVKFNNQNLNIEQVAYCSQFMADAFFTGSISEEIKYTLKFSDSSKSEDEIWLLMKQLGFAKEKYSSISPFYLNQSEQKLFSFILTIIKNFEILLLDETDSGISFAHKKLLIEILKKFSDKIVIVISHDIWFINQLPAKILNLKTDSNYNNYSNASEYFQGLNLQNNQLDLILNKDSLLQKLRNNKD